MVNVAETHDLIALMRERISTGLQRKTITNCAKWAVQYRVMAKPFPGPWGWKYHRWLQGMHESEAEMNVGQKAAQMGFTEWALNMTFYKIDVEGTDCLYVLPTDSDASDFSSGRFDPALEGSPHVTDLFSDVKNVGHKRAGQQNLYVRGSKSRSKLKSIPCGFLCFDEVEEMDQDNIPLAMTRQDGQLISQVLMISTPHVPKAGINKYYIESTQEHFFFKCPCCSRHTELIYPECLVITAETIHDPQLTNSHYICKECKGTLHHQNKWEWLESGIWVPEHSDRLSRGFTISQMYSSAKSGKPETFATESIKARTDKTVEQELYNSKIGVPHIVDGAQITDGDINLCIHNYLKGDQKYPIRTMGVDVGKKIHYEIDEWILPDTKIGGIDINDQSICRLLMEGYCYHFEELDDLMRKYGIRGCVVDRHPESRKALEFAQRFYGHVLLCMYGRGLMGKNVSKGTDVELTITVDRTSWLDLSLGRFYNRTIQLPHNVSEEFRSHIKEPVRQYIKDKDGNPVGRYTNAKDDHAAHARNYAEIALPLALSSGQSYDIKGVF